MKTMNLRDANQQFSSLVKHVQETGETIQILRNGEPAAELHPIAGQSARRNLSSRQQAALKSILETAHRVRAKSRGRKMTRDEMHER